MLICHFGTRDELLREILSQDVRPPPRHRRVAYLDVIGASAPPRPRTPSTPLDVAIGGLAPTTLKDPTEEDR
jgi:hypothetical protein